MNFQSKPLTTFLKYTTLLATLAFVLVVLLQIFARLFLPTAPSWTEEAARVCFVFAIGAAAGLALRSGDYVRFDVLYERLGPAAQRGLSLLIDASTVVLFLLFTAGAVRFTIMGWAERSPTLQFPMAIPFSGIAILGLSLLLFALDRLRRSFTNAPDAP